MRSLGQRYRNGALCNHPVDLVWRVFARHAASTGAIICDDVFIDAPLAEGLALDTELKGAQPGSRS